MLSTTDLTLKKKKLSHVTYITVKCTSLNLMNLYMCVPPITHTQPQRHTHICNYHPGQDTIHFQHRSRPPCSSFWSELKLSSPLPSWSLLFGLLSLILPRLQYKWTHTVWFCLYQTLFTEYICEVHSCCLQWWQFFFTALSLSTVQIYQVRNLTFCQLMTIVN